MAKLKHLPHEETMELIQAAQGGCKEARDRLIETNTRLLWKVVHRFKNRGYELEDLFQVGAIGMLKSIDKFDSSFGVKFSTYAVPMVSGEIQRFVRDGGAVKVPRPMKDLAYKITSNNLFNSPLEHISEVLGEENLELIRVTIQYISGGLPQSMDAVVFSNGDGEDITLADQLSNDVNGDNWLDNIAVRAAVAQLSPRDREIIELRYFHERTQPEIAKQLGVSQAQISRLERKILERMRKLVEEENRDMPPKAKGNREEAIRLLEVTELPYKQIAEETGVPFGTIGALGKKHRSKEVSKKNTSPGRPKAGTKDKKKKVVPKEQPVVTPVISLTAFRSVTKEEEEMRDIKFASTPVDEFSSPPEVQTIDIVLANPAGTQTGRFPSSEPNVSSPPRSEDPTEVMDIIGEKEEPVVAPTIDFKFRVVAEGEKATKEEVLGSLETIAEMVKTSPFDTFSLYVRVNKEEV